MTGTIHFLDGACHPKRTFLIQAKHIYTLLITIIEGDGVRRRRSNSAVLALVGGSVLVIGMLFLLIHFFPSEKHEAERTVDRFYMFEQQGEFGQSWNLFHSLMKDKFSKDTYVKRREDIFWNHFKAKTFTYTIGKLEKKSSWKMEGANETFKDVYVTTASKTYHSSFGIFTMKQKCVVVKEDGNWRILWVYR
ncbi:hypothetical protein [Falsibacillus albus]|uniref:DUF4878 domain-containing protein n=1 Tax=Falsibacillus albus TaxID=2478915 RepID=A0A3L7K1C7_9BACI|nr:hypothetical protein [Falsibacillus albus]RLQ96868.1 hypothetical protein D9X91_07160 [Falsibacillus albus]